MPVYANNQSGAKEGYEKSWLYEVLYSSVIPEYINFRQDRLFYGKVDYDFDTVMIRRSVLKRFEQEKTVHALHFVVDAYEDMKKYLKRCINRNLIVPAEDDFLNDLTVQKGLGDPLPKYAEYIKNINLVFLNTYLPISKMESKIENVSDYIKYFLEFFYNVATFNSLTRTKYLLTNMISPNASGLCVEISNLNHAADDPKVVEYFQHKDFGFYVKTARKFGFLIDQNAPWRLVANFSSPLMSKYMDKYGVTRDNIFEKCFQKTYKYDIETLKRYLVFYYNNFAQNLPTTKRPETIVCGEHLRTRTRTTHREPMVYSDTMVYEDGSGLSDNYWLLQYYLLRTKESGIEVDKFKKRREERKLILMKKYVDIETAIEYINKETKTTFRHFSKTPGRYPRLANVVRPGREAEGQPVSQVGAGAMKLAASQTGIGPPTLQIDVSTPAGRGLLEKVKALEEQRQASAAPEEG